MFTQFCNFSDIVRGFRHIADGAISSGWSMNPFTYLPAVGGILHQL